MKKLSIYFLVATILLAGCKKTYDDSINGLTADERVAAAMAAYQSKLMSSPYGWIFTETTTGIATNGTTQAGPIATFAYYMQFTDSTKVTQFSDFDTLMAVTPKSSGYRVKSLQRPALIFDTYGYIHVPCDPDVSISKSPFGTSFGWGTDFEFSFVDNVDPTKLGDTIALTGNLNSAKAVLVKATQAQRDAYYAGKLKATMTAWGSIQNYFKRVTAGATQFEMTPGLSGAKSVDINTLDGTGNLKSTPSNVYFTATSVNLITPVTVGTTVVNRFDNIVWDPGTSTISTNINGTTAATIAGAIAPLKNDVNAPYAWWNGSVTSKSYYFSNSGYHVNGVDDFYGVTKLANWWYMLFWAKYNSSGATFYDANAGVVNGSLIGAATFSPNPPPATSTTITTFTPDGRIIFKLLGSFGSATSILNTTVRTQTLNPAGYYLILKEDGKSYDMVVASDAKAWLTWSPWWNQ